MEKYLEADTFDRYKNISLYDRDNENYLLLNTDYEELENAMDYKYCEVKIYPNRTEPSTKITLKSYITQDAIKLENAQEVLNVLKYSDYNDLKAKPHKSKKIKKQEETDKNYDYDTNFQDDIEACVLALEKQYDKAKKKSEFEEETTEKYGKTIKNFNRAYKNFAESMRCNIELNNTLLMTFNNGAWTYEEADKLLKKYNRAFAERYKAQIKCWHCICEPCESGSWHLHYMPTFNELSTQLDKDIRDWTAKWLTKNEPSIKIYGDKGGFNAKIIRKNACYGDTNTIEHLIKYFWTTKNKKKKERIKFYESGRKVFRRGGQLVEPICVSLPTGEIGELIKNMAGEELLANRQNILIYDEIGKVVYFSSARLYNITSTSYKSAVNMYLQHTSPRYTANPTKKENGQANDFNLYYYKYSPYAIELKERYRLYGQYV